jgi:hypothetical protein
MYEYHDYEEAEQLEGDAASPCDTEQRYAMRQEADAAKVAEVLSILTATGFAAVLPRRPRRSGSRTTGASAAPSACRHRKTATR